MLKKIIRLLSIIILMTSAAFAQQSQMDSDLNFGKELFQNKMYDLAEEQFAKFLQEYPASSSAGQARYYLAMSQYEQKKYGKAAANFQAFAVQYPNDPNAPKAWISAGESYAMVKDYADAALSYERYRVFYPKDVNAPVALLKAGKYFELAGDTARAEVSLLTIVQDYSSTSSYFDATLRLGNLYFNSGELLKADNQYRALLTSDNDSVRVMGLLALGRLNRLRGLPQQAEEYLREAAALGIAPQSYEAMLETVELDLQAGNYALAVRNADQISAAKLSQTQKERLAFEKAYAHIALGSASGNRLLVTSAASLAWKYKIRLASLLNRKGEYEQGLSIMSNLPSKESTESDLRLYSELAFRAGKMRLADSILTEAASQERHPDVRIVVKMLNIESIYLKDRERARETFFRYENVLKQRPDAYEFYRALSEEGAGNYAAAIKDYEQMAAEYPESNYAKAADSLARFDRNYKEVNYRDAVVSMADILLEQGASDRTSALLHLGTLYENELKDYGKAARVYKHLAATTTGDTARIAEYLYAVALEREGEGRSANDSDVYAIYRKLTAGLAADSIAERSLFRLAELQAFSGDSLGAESSVLDFLKRFPGSRLVPRAHLLLAEVLYNTGAFHAAIAQAALARSLPEARLLGAKSEIAVDSLQDARRMLGAFLASHPPKKFALEGQLLYAGLLQKMNVDAAPAYQALLEELIPSGYRDAVSARLADYLYSAGNYDSAYTVYRTIGKDELWYVTPPSILYRMAYCKLKAGDLNDARNLFQEVAANSADSAQVYNSYDQLGGIYASLGDKRMSASFYERAGAGNLSALRMAADTYFSVKDYADAARVYNELLGAAQTDTTKAFSAARLVDIEYLTGRIRSADLSAEKFRNTYRDPGGRYRARFLVYKAEYLIGTQKYTEAERLLSDVRRNYDGTPSYPQALLDEARISVAVGNLDKAESRLKNILAKFGKSAVAPEAHLELGNIYYAREKYKDASDNFRDVYLDSLASRNVLRDAMSRLISSYESIGMYDGALDITRKFIKMFPEDKSIMDKRIQVGILYEELKYFDQALITFKSLVKAANRDYQAELHYYIGAIYDDKGEYANAILEFLKVPYLVTHKEVVDWAAQAYYMAGKCYEKLNKPDEAIAMYEKIVHKPNTDPTFIAGAEREINRVKALLK